MAVYTEISDRELADFVTLYDIGTVLSCRGMAEGIENSNYLLTTDRAAYVLTLFERRVTEAELPFFMGLMTHLTDQGLPCPVPIRARDGAILHTLCDRPAVIVSFLDGAWPRHPTQDQCARVGRALARLHMAGNSFTMTRPNDMSHDTWGRLIDQCRDRADDVADGLGAEISAALQTVNDQWPDRLPTGIIHADMFPDNVFFQDGELTGLLDFYFACNDFLAYDLAIAINAWCFDDDGAFHQDRSSHLMSGYQGIRTLTDGERAAIPILCQGAALRFLLTRLYDQLFPTDGPLVTPKDPLEFLTRLRFHQQADGVASYGLEPRL